MTLWLDSADRAPGAVEPDAVRRLSVAYDRIRADGREAVLHGHEVLDPLPLDGQERWGLSAVLRPTRWSKALSNAVKTLSRVTGDRGFVYGPTDLHLTIRQFEGYREHVPANDPVVAACIASLSVVTGRLAPIVIDFEGLNLSPAGVLMQGWPRIDLQALRTDLHRVSKACGVPAAGPERSVDRLRTTAHATLSIFEAPLVKREALIAAIDAQRTTSFGTATFDALWLVGYRRGRRALRLIEYARFELGAVR